MTSGWYMKLIKASGGLSTPDGQYKIPQPEATEQVY
jgi:hypothetical protein